ncbi:MAG: Y-family DNA polymerase, partial [Burkholderiales bacterium]
MYIDFNSYFASVEQQENPALRGHPTIVVPMQADTTCAIAASVEAKRFGIRTGTKVYEARRLCPQVVLVTADHRRYVDYHHRLLAVIEDHIPITRVGSIDEVACRLLDNENNPQFATRLAHRIKADLAKRVGERMTCSIGVAPSPLLAKLASDAQKPDGLVIFEEADLPRCLYPMQLRDICGIGRNMEQQLARKRIATIEQFCALGPRRAGAIWGSRAGDRLWFELHGIGMPPIVTHTRSLGHSHMLAPINRQPDKAHMVLRRLTLKAAARMRRKGYCTARVLISVRLATDYSKWKGACAVAITQDSFALLDAVDGLWEEMMMAMQQRGPRPSFQQVSVCFLELEPV